MPLLSVFIIPSMAERLRPGQLPQRLLEDRLMEQPEVEQTMERLCTFARMLIQRLEDHQTVLIQTDPGLREKYREMYVRSLRTLLDNPRKREYYKIAAAIGDVFKGILGLFTEHAGMLFAGYEQPLFSEEILEHFPEAGVAYYVHRVEPLIVFAFARGAMGQSLPRTLTELESLRTTSETEGEINASLYLSGFVDVCIADAEEDVAHLISRRSRRCCNRCS